MLTCQDHIVLIEAGQSPYKEMYNLPGGGIEFGETPEEALTRELAEEAGLTDLSQPNLVGALSQVERHPDQGDAEIHLLGILFRVELDSRMPVKEEPDGHDSLAARWIDQRDLDRLTIGRFAQQGIDN